MSRRESDDNSTPEGAPETRPGREPEVEVDHARLAQLVADNYTPPAPSHSPTISDAPPAVSSASPNDAPLLRARAARAASIGRAHVAVRPDPVMQPAAAAPAPPRVAAPKRLSLLPVGCALLVLLSLVGVALFSWWPSRQAAVRGPIEVDNPGGVASTDESQDASALQVLVVLGGTFRMGRDDVPEALINEYPAHEVTVKTFQMDRTEVTNAEYAEFVRATGYAPPRDERLGDKEAAYWKPWTGGQPPAGQERWPVRNVTLKDAEAFAAWRSRRDGVAYRLPTEEEWEYAARSGGQSTFYPWGDGFLDDCANLDAELPRPVGSYPRGASRHGVLDLIGNVWEWTSSDASVYPGNHAMRVIAGQKVARGGSYQSKARGSAAVTATSRIFMPPETKHPTLGFRLVRDGT